MEASPNTTSNESVNITEQKHKIEYIVVEGMVSSTPSYIMNHSPLRLPFLVDRVNQLLNEGWELQGGVSRDERYVVQAMIKKH